MKKIFVLLFSIWIPIYLVIGLVAATGNTVSDDDLQVKEGPHSTLMMNADAQLNASFNYAGSSYLY